MTERKIPTIVTGVQPTGPSHLGHYAGIYRNMVALQEREARRFYFIADYHSLSEDYDPSEKSRQIMDLAAELLAIGVDPKKTTLFVQSHVPEHTELCWILNTVTPISFLERMTQYKDKASRQKQNINVGLFAYPVLQAADILIYRADQVPVGRDQLQHLELTRDIAGFFNNRFGRYFTEPKPLLTETPKIRGLNDPLKKMSKSLGGKSYVALRDDPDTICAKLKSAVTETTGILKYSEEELERRLGGPNPALTDGEGTDLCGQAGAYNLLTLLKLAGGEREARLIMAGQPIRYGELKRLVAERLSDHFADFRQKYEKFREDEDHLKEILKKGAETAGKTAGETLKEVRKLVGVR
ncbi:tryptophan--tRNA ligase [Candidatus Uhrbacteria bacterium]|nr:tryptophan--tRNA ligase [Candidatus Uhrbacteria bacterium]